MSFLCYVQESEDHGCHGTGATDSIDSGFPMTSSSSSPSNDDDSQSRGHRSRTTSSSAGNNMSPIHETPNTLPRYPDVSFGLKLKQMEGEEPSQC